MSLNLEKHLNKKVKHVKKEKTFVKCNTTNDVFKMQLERLMSNPERDVAIPDAPQEAAQPKVLEFNPNIHGSNAGAGSGEFHVYRADRRREERRQAWLEDKERQVSLTAALCRTSAPRRDDRIQTWSTALRRFPSGLNQLSPVASSVALQKREAEEFAAKEAQLKAEQEAKTAKKRAKRQKAKLRKLQARAKADSAAASDPSMFTSTRI
eukprot:TRINITY_DN10317_c1_g1_i2.p1 TRINITY_DN10317_c1_g1~~TRINITY_DN10317_c1_g1_i2.p1  ORF type:complete len:209 (+),score=51.65 TRINITY_DN10317_c1_g1_i2:153-779(+)